MGKIYYLFIVALLLFSLGFQGTTYANSNDSDKANDTNIQTLNTSVTTSRLSGKNRYETAIKISQDGWTTAETVVLAKGSDFPDALSGAPLAYKENAPILLTDTKSLTGVTKDEIKRLKAKKVIILGSEGAVSKSVSNELKNMNLDVKRIGGKSRYETAALIANELNSKTAVIAYGKNFPDALAIAPYAAKNGIPILLTAQDELPSASRNVIQSMDKAIIVGSTAVVSKKVESSLPVSSVSRYGGSDRYETAKSIITNLRLGTDKAYVATGRNFPDALAGSALAAKDNAPILLINDSKIPESTKSLIPKYKSFGIIGGKGIIGEAVEYQLKGASDKGCDNPIHNTSMYADLYKTFEEFYFGCSPEYVKSQLGEPDKVIGMETEYAYQYGDIQYKFVHFEDYGVVGVNIKGKKASSYFSNFDEIEKAYNPNDLYASYNADRYYSNGSYVFTVDDSEDYQSGTYHSYHSKNKSGSPISMIDIYYRYW